MEFDVKKCLRAEIVSEELTRPGPEKKRSLEKMWLDKNENTDSIIKEIGGKILREMELEAITTYPDCYNLYEKLARYDHLQIENLLITAGSDGAIRTVFESTINSGDRVMHTNPTFAMYYVYSKMFGANVFPVEYEASINGPVLNVQRFIEKIKSFLPKLICLPNPDSPTGTVIDNGDLKKIISAAMEVNALVLIDEAYYPFYASSALPWINDFPNLIVARTFAKAWGAAGFRIGYLAANKNLASYLHKVKPMYEVNTLSLRFMEKMLDHEKDVEESVKRILDGKTYFIEEMSKLGFKTVATNANFIHVNFGRLSQKIHDKVSNYVLYRHNFSHPSLLEYARFTVAPKDVMKDVVELIKKAINS
jgi:histidinol-phosphate aminotransferase